MRSGRIRVRGENRGRCRNKRNGPIIKMSNLCPDCPGHRAAKWAIKDIQDDNCLVKTLYHQPDYSGSSAGRSLTPWLFFKVMKEYAMFNKAGRKKYWWSVFLFHVLSLSLSHSCQRGWLEEPGSSQCVQQPDRRAAHSDQQPAEAQTPQPWVGHRVYLKKIFVFSVLCVCDCGSSAMPLLHPHSKLTKPTLSDRWEKGGNCSFEHLFICGSLSSPQDMAVSLHSTELLLSGQGSCYFLISVCDTNHFTPVIYP